MKGLLRHLAGWASLLIGVVGLVAPIIPGWLFIALGALLLSPDLPFFARLVDRVERRFPALQGALRRFRRRFGHHLERRSGPPS